MFNILIFSFRKDWEFPAPEPEEPPPEVKKALDLVDYWRNSVYFMKNPEAKPEVVKYTNPISLHMIKSVITFFSF